MTVKGYLSRVSTFFHAIDLFGLQTKVEKEIHLAVIKYCKQRLFETKILKGFDKKYPGDLAPKMTNMSF